MKKPPRAWVYEDLTGQTHGLVTVVARDLHYNIGGGVRWLCVCTCGKARWFVAGNLKQHAPKTHRACKRGFDFDPEKIAAYRNHLSRHRFADQPGNDAISSVLPGAVGTV